MSASSWTRRQAALAASSLLAAPFIARHALGQSTYDPRRFAGQSVEVMHVKGPRADFLQRYEKEFTKATGIVVNSESLPEQQQRQKAAIEFASRNTSFDVIMLALHVQKRLAAKGGWLADLRPMLADPTMLPPDYDEPDMTAAARAWMTQANGAVDAIPINIDYFLLYANQEILQQKGIAVPATLDELVRAAKALNDSAAGISGWVGRGLKNANVPVWTSFLLGWNVDAVDARGELRTTGPEAIAAAEIYRKLYTESAPAGVVGYNWMEAQALFMQGKAALWLDSIGLAQPVEDPAKSRVVGKVSYNLPPRGPVAQHAGSFCDAMAVSAFTRKQGPAFAYVAWATGRDIQARMLKAGAGSPGRKSAFVDPSVKEGASPSARAVMEAITQAGAIGRPGLPSVIPVTEFRDIFGIALTNMTNGGQVKDELAKATEQFKPILERSEKA